MSKLTFYNYNRHTFNPHTNLLTETINLHNFPQNLEIIFPYDLPKFFQSNYTLDHTSIINHKPHNTYRIMFSPRQIANNKFSFDFNDLACVGVDLALGQEIEQRLPYSNYFRLPMWCVELFGLLPTIQDIQNKINQLEALRKQNPFKRAKFLGLVAKRDKKYYLSSVKGMVLDLIADDNYLSTLIVESAGRFRNNTNDLYHKYNDDKVEYLKQFTFNLCPESMNYFNVITEKLAHCLEAGCIPIYWGDLSLDAKYFNLAAMIQFDPSRRMDLPLKIKEAFYYADEFISQNIFNEDAAQFIFEDIYFPIFRKIEQDLKLPIYSLRSNWKQQ